MQNLNDLVTDLAEVFEDLKHDRIDLQKAKAMCDVAGRIVGTINTQIQIIMVGGTEITPFMKGHTEKLRTLKPAVPKPITVAALKKRLQGS